jgi:hypothetical protein
MSIEKNEGFDTYDIVCDNCGEETNEDFDSFQEAVEWKKDKSNGWKSKKVNGKWEDHCPECVK